MNRLVVIFTLFALILLFVTAPFAGLAGLMLFLLVPAVFWVFYTMAATLLVGAPKTPSRKEPGNT
jgi:hypothetical protein